MTISRKTTLLLLSCLFFTVHCSWPNICQFQRQDTKSEVAYRTVSYIHRTTTCCGFLCWSRCTKYRVAYRTELIMSHQSNRYEHNTDSCYGYCSNSECKGCNPVLNCVNTRCFNSSDQYCLECAHDRGGERKAYELVNRGGITNGACEQRCSWRPESKFCYPGSCPSTPDSCTCAPGFSGTNCLNTTIVPTISPCTVTLKDGSNNNSLACSVDNAPIYSSLKATVLAIHWKTSYDPVTLTDYPSPYYVNSSGFGIVDVTLAWNLKRGNITLEGGTEYCLTADILSTQIKTKQCNHSVVFNSELKHNDVLWFQVRSNTSGYININNYDDPDKVTLNGAQFYSQQRNFLSNFVVFDLIAPQHCRQRSPPCTSHLFSISEVYTKNSSVLVRMDPTLWQDDSGVNRISWEVYQVTSDIQLTGNLQQRSQLNNIPSQDKPGSTIVVEFPEAGVYSIILTVFDNVGNAAKARRVVMYDDLSSISVSEDNPITVSDAVVNNGVSWLGTKSGQITIIWAGHFYNSFHRDNNLLAVIEEMDPPLPAEYDETTGQPPLTRSREAIPNVEGITRFEFDYATSSSGKTKPDWKDIGQKTETIVTVPSVDGDHISVWLKAFDVMGNSREDLVKFYLDSSPPLITYLDYMYRDTIDSSVHVKRDNDNTVHIFIDAHDDDSGISMIKWRLLDTHEQTTTFEEGEIKNTYHKNPDDKECTPLTCHCLPQEDLDMCFYPSHSVFLDLNTMASMPEGDVDCSFTAVVYNNAMKQSETSIQFMVHK